MVYIANLNDIQLSTNEASIPWKIKQNLNFWLHFYAFFYLLWFPCDTLWIKDLQTMDISLPKDSISSFFTLLTNIYNAHFWYSDPRVCCLMSSSVAISCAPSFTQLIHLFLLQLALRIHQWTSCFRRHMIRKLEWACLTCEDSKSFRITSSARRLRWQMDWLYDILNVDMIFIC